jgi:hypothetical protein
LVRNFQKRGKTHELSTGKKAVFCGPPFLALFWTHLVPRGKRGVFKVSRKNGGQKGGFSSSHTFYWRKWGSEGGFRGGPKRGQKRGHFWGVKKGSKMGGFRGSQTGSKKGSKRGGFPGGFNRYINWFEIFKKGKNPTNFLPEKKRFFVVPLF